MDSEKINKIYNKQSYFAKYGKDVFASISIILFFTVLSVYFLLKSSLGSIKEKLKDNRCDAKYLFFSGWVSKREDQTEFGATTENMFICLNDLVKAAMVVFTDPFNDVINTSYLKSLLTTTTTNIFALEASSMNLFNLNLMVGLTHFKDNLKALFVPIVKIGEIMNDTVKKLSFVLDVMIKNAEIMKYNVQFLILSMYSALLHIALKIGDDLKVLVITGVLILAVGAGFLLSFILFPLGIPTIAVGTLILLVALITYMVQMSVINAAGSLHPLIKELYPEAKMKHYSKAQGFKI